MQIKLALKWSIRIGIGAIQYIQLSKAIWSGMARIRLGPMDRPKQSSRSRQRQSIPEILLMTPACWAESLEIRNPWDLGGPSNRKVGGLITLRKEVNKLPVIFHVSGRKLGRAPTTPTSLLARRQE